NVEFHYADRIIVSKSPSLIFSNPFIPYKCEKLDQVEGGAYCIFTKEFLNENAISRNYSVFHPQGNHIFPLSKIQAKKVAHVFEEMKDELNSNYSFKYDMLRNKVYDLIHFALKMQPPTQQGEDVKNAAQRIASLFIELLERQFPIEEHHPRIQFRSPSDFAEQMNIHVNHLNGVLKEVTGYTTSELIAQRILEESKILLRQSTLNISEIGYALGFKEVPHFNNFFKKHTQVSPMKFRKGLLTPQ
ncbi:MAG: hypothetical protein RL131_741, partial [Bacteroidota bacterium]